MTYKEIDGVRYYKPTKQRSKEYWDKLVIALLLIVAAFELYAVLWAGHII